MYDGCGSAGICVAREQNVDPIDGARECYVGIDITLQSRVALRVGLHRCRLPLMGEEHDEVDLVANRRRW